MARRLLDTLRQWPGVVLACAMSLTYLVVLIPAQDYASGEFRAQLSASGARLWNNMWFGGHPLPAYGMVSAWLSGWVGVRVVAAVSVVVATWGFSSLVRKVQPQFAGSAALSSSLFAACVGINMWAGRLTFAPSVAFGVLAFVALRKDRTFLACLASAACALSSPVGGVFLLTILIALWINSWQRKSVFICGVSAVVPLGVVLLFFSEGGWFPFRWQSLLMVGLNVGVLAAVAWRNAVVRTTIALYTTLVVIAFLVKTPLGGNVVRLGWISTGVLAVFFVPSSRRLVVATISILTLVWNGIYLPIGRSVNVASAKSSFYEPVASFLEGVPGVHKVEVVPTNVRRESDVLALRFPIARGWQTQIDRDRNALFYSADLSAAAYETWLHENAVSYIAVPNQFAHPDAAPEVALVRSLPNFLNVVYKNTSWTILEVRQATPLATNGSEVIRVTPEQIILRAQSTGWTTVRFRHTPLYQVTSGDACVSSTEDGWIRVMVRKPGDITLTVKISVDGLLRRTPRCG